MQNERKTVAVQILDHSLTRIHSKVTVPLNVLNQWQQAAGVADQFIQERNNIGELGPMTSLLLPAV